MITSPGNTWRCLETFFIVLTGDWGVGATGIQWVEAGVLRNIPQFTGQTLQQRIILPPNVKSVEGEKPGLSEWPKTPHGEGTLRALPPWGCPLPGCPQE